MAKILFTWELGAGSGHVAPYLNLIKKLEANGHQVFFAVKCLSKASRLFAGTRVTYLQAPILIAPSSQLVNPIDSFAKILNNYGYADSQQLAGMIKAWLNLYKLLQPDILISDYSPTALLAAREQSFKRLTVGSGFYTPTNTCPTLGLQTLQGVYQDSEPLLAFENNILEKINQALALNQMQALNCFYDMHNVDQRLLLTLPEFDHYPDRKDANYIGMCKSPLGIQPEWPNYPGAKIFMYLKPFPTLPQLLEHLNRHKFPTLIYVDGIPETIIQQHTSATLHFVDRPLDMDTIGKTADVGICNGNYGTVFELLLSGVPILTLPLHAEQYIVSRNLEKLGAGLSAPQKHPDGMRIKLKRLLEEPQFKQAAMAFAQRHSDITTESTTNKILETINQLLGIKED